MGGGALGHGLRPPHGGDVVAQLRHQHRGGLLGVVAHAVAGPAHHQPAAGGQQGFEHELAVVVAARAVAGAQVSGQGHQVEVAAQAAPGVVAVVHAQQAQHFKRNGTHGHQGAEGHATGPEALVEAGHFQRLQPRMAEHRHVHVIAKSGLGAGLAPGRECGIQRGHGFLVGLVGRGKAGLQQVAATLHPHLGGSRLAGLRPPVQQHPDEVGQAARQLGIQPADFGIRLGGAPAFQLGHVGQRAGGIAHEHALQGKPGRVLLAATGQPQLLAVGRVQPPAHARAAHPPDELGQLLGSKAKPRGQGGHFQQVGQLAQAATLGGHAQQPLQRRHHQAAGLGAEVGNVEGDVTPVVALVLAEHGPDGGGHGFDVGHHHHHIAGLQRSGLARLAGGVQPQQQLVVQHLQLTHRAVRGVKANGRIGGFQRPNGRIATQRLQIADAVLHAGEQRGVGGFLAVVKHIDARQVEPGLGGGGIVVRVQLADEVAPLAAPGGQQRVGMLVHVLQGHHRQVGSVACGLAAALGFEQLAPLHDVAPVVLARVGHGQQHLAMLAQGGQRLQRGAGQMAHAVHHHAPRHPVTEVFVALQPVEHLPVQSRACGGLLALIQRLHHSLPEHGLPALIGRQGFMGAVSPDQLMAALHPELQPVCAVILVLVQQIGQTCSQLNPTVGFLRAQIALHRGKFRQGQQAGQHLHQPPGEGQFVQRRVARHRTRTQNLPVGAPDEAPRQLHPHRGAHAGLPRHVHLEPLGHAIALHQHHFFFQRVERMQTQPVDHSLRQIFGTVAMQRNESGGNGTAQARLLCGQGLRLTDEQHTIRHFDPRHGTAVR